MGYIGLIVGAVVATIVLPKAAAEAYRRSQRKIEDVRRGRAKSPS